MYSSSKPVQLRSRPSLNKAMRHSHRPVTTATTSPKKIESAIFTFATSAKAGITSKGPVDHCEWMKTRQRANHKTDSTLCCKRAKVIRTRGPLPRIAAFVPKRKLRGLISKVPAVPNDVKKEQHRSCRDEICKSVTWRICSISFSKIIS